MKELEKAKKFVIDRAKWLRGTGEGTLLDKQGKMCCLGFYMLACGATPKDIKYVGEPESTDLGIPKCMKSTHGDYTCTVDRLIHANDMTDTTEEKRENRITNLFKHIGIDVTFKGKK